MAQEEVSLGPALFLPIRGMEVSEKSIAYPTRKSHGQGFPDPMSFQVTHSATSPLPLSYPPVAFPPLAFPSSWLEVDKAGVVDNYRPVIF